MYKDAIEDIDNFIVKELKNVLIQYLRKIWLILSLIHIS